MSIWNESHVVLLRHPLDCAGRTLSFHPVELVKVIKVAHAPLGGSHDPCAFKAAGDGVASVTGAALIFPAHALLFDGSCCWLSTETAFWTASTVSFTKTVTASDQRHSLFIIHRHTRESFADVFS